MQSGKAPFFFPFSYCHRDSTVSGAGLPSHREHPRPVAGGGQDQSWAQGLVLCTGACPCPGVAFCLVTRCLQSDGWGKCVSTLRPGHPTQPAPCLSPRRARILFLLQLLADHVPGISLVTSKHGPGCDYSSMLWPCPPDCFLFVSL